MIPSELVLFVMYNTCILWPCVRSFVIVLPNPLSVRLFTGLSIGLCIGLFIGLSIGLSV